MAVSGLSQTHQREHQGARARPSELPLVPPLSMALLAMVILSLSHHCIECTGHVTCL